jgi:hypothetical protein
MAMAHVRSPAGDWVWTGFLFTVAFVFVSLLSGCASLRANPWALIDSKAKLKVVNMTNEQRGVSVWAPALPEHGKRFLGSVPPRDSVTWVLPYADTQVIVGISVANHAAEEYILKSLDKAIEVRLMVEYDSTQIRN